MRVFALLCMLITCMLESYAGLALLCMLIPCLLESYAGLCFVMNVDSVHT